MRRTIAAAVLFMAFSATLPASDFDWMVREFARQSGTQPMHIPFFGLARFIVAVAHPAGASELKLAVFENLKVQPDNFAALADSTVGPAWKTIVRIRSSNGECSNVYAQPDGKHLRVLVATRSKSDMVFVQLRIQPEELMKFVDGQRRERHI